MNNIGSQAKKTRALSGFTFFFFFFFFFWFCFVKISGVIFQIYTWPWYSDDINTEKTPTCVLFDKDKKFVAFGYEVSIMYTLNMLRNFFQQTTF